MQAAAFPQSPYLVSRLLSRTQETLFDYVKFRAIREVLPKKTESLRLADFGCGPHTAARRLCSLHVAFEYCGVDYESDFAPDVVGDLRSPEQLADQLPWAPDVIMLLDVLEHLDGQQSDIRAVLRCCRELLKAQGGQLVITVPQMYRLDKLKLSHLHYPEHKVRLTQAEWRSLIEEHFQIEEIRPVGFLSVLPYLPMLSSRYQPDNWLGKTFRYLRENAFEQPWIHKLDWWLSCHSPQWSKEWSNDILFAARPR